MILWDRGNNDLPFFRPDLNIVVADPQRAGHELHYCSGETNLCVAEVVVVNRADTALPADIATVEANVRLLNRAQILKADSWVTAREPESDPSILRQAVARAIAPARRRPQWSRGRCDAARSQAAPLPLRARSFRCRDG